MDSEKLAKAGINIDSLVKRLMGNESLIRVIVKKFIDDKSFDELIKAFEENDSQLAELKSHTLKGMCGNLSIELLYNLFSEQTNLIRNSKFTEAKNMMPTITEAYKNAVLMMASWLDEN